MEIQKTVVADGLPSPPVDSVFNLSFANTTTEAYAVIIFVVLSWAMLRSDNRKMALAVILGGASVAFFEPIFDVLTGCWHPEVNQNVVFSMLGRDIPVWVFAGYTGYYGCSAYVMLQSFLKGISTRGVWLWCLLPLGFDIVMEELMLHWNLYHYYGNQPLVLIKFPLYQPACNTTGMFFGVSMLYLLHPVLKQSWKWFPAAIVVIPLCGAMGFVGAGLPSICAINTTSFPYWFTQLCGVTSCVLMFGFVYCFSLMVAVDSPYRRIASPHRMQPSLVL